MLTFVTFLWRQPGYHTAYGAEHVRRWAKMVRKHYRREKRLVLVTDEPGEYGRGIEVVPLWDDCASLANPHGQNFPSCYRRLRLWAPDAGQVFGERILLMDLDCTVLGNLSPLVDRTEDVVFWRDPGYPQQPYNGGMILMRAGSRPQVWSQFAGEDSIRRARAAGYKGSDQAWIAFCLGSKEAVWTAADGVVSWKRDLRRGEPRPGDRVVMFHGTHKPWHDSVPAVYR